MTTEIGIPQGSIVSLKLEAKGEVLIWKNQNNIRVAIRVTLILVTIKKITSPYHDILDLLFYFMCLIQTIVFLLIII